MLQIIKENNFFRLAQTGRASDRSWEKKSNFAGFLGTNSQKILQNFSGQTSLKSSWYKAADFVVIFR